MSISTKKMTKTCLQRRMEWKRVTTANGRSPGARAAVLSTFTAYPIEPYLGMTFKDNGVDIKTWAGPYNQILQQCLDDKSETALYKPNILIVWPRFEDLWNNSVLPLDDDFFVYERLSNEIAVTSLNAAKRWGCKLVFVLPAIPESRPLGVGDAGGVRCVFAMASRLRESLRCYLAGEENVFIVDAEEGVRNMGIAKAYNYKLYDMARIPYSEELFRFVGERSATLLSLDTERKANVLVLEPDNVLWNGLIADKGVQEVNLSNGGAGEMFLDFQKFLLEVKRAGTALVLCSKCTEDVISKVFKRNEMLMNKHDFILHYFDVSDPNEILPDVVEKLETNYRSVTFVSRKESFPSVLSKAEHLALSDEPAEWSSQLVHSGALDKPHIYGANMLHTAPEPNKTGTLTGNLESFLENLDLNIDFVDIKTKDYQHASHLTDTVSEFNLTGEKRSREEIADLIKHNSFRCWGVNVSDRFGDYGMAGLVFFSIGKKEIVVDTFLFNCRVLGRNVELTALGRLEEIAREYSCEAIKFRYKKTGNNKLGLEFISRVLGKSIPEHEEGFLSITLAALTKHLNKNKHNCSKHREAKKTAQNTESIQAFRLLEKRWNNQSVSQKEEVLDKITKIFSRAEYIVSAVNKKRQRSRPDISVSYVQPRSDVEKKLAEIWSRMLGVEDVGVFDNFFHLGGHSVLAAQLIFELSEEFGVELPVKIFFDTPTVATMAQSIEAIQRRSGSDEDDVMAKHNYLTREYFFNEVECKIPVPTENIPAGNYRDPSHIFLSGASGFLGAFMISEFVKSTRAVIHCLVRGQNEEDALEKIRKNMEYYYMWDDALLKRIKPVVGDLSKEKLGLSKELWDELAEITDVIVHNGAVTNFIDPYSKIKQANVMGTSEMLRLAAYRKLKAFHHMSTLYIFLSQDSENGKTILESDLPNYPELLHLAYRQSKWVAEGMVREAAKKGLPVVIYRLGRLSGDSNTGACQTKDFLWRMIKASTEVGCVLNHKIKMDMVPVDFAAKAITNIMLREEPQGRIFHIFNPASPYLDEVVGWISSFGFQLETVDYKTWRSCLIEKARTSSTSASAGLLAFVPQKTPQWNKDVAFDESNVRNILKDTFFERPEVDKSMFRKYLDYFVKTGYIKEPQRRINRQTIDRDAACAST